MTDSLHCKQGGGRLIMKIFIAGGSGLVGRHLASLLVEKGHQVTALGRSINAETMPGGVEVIRANAEEAGLWQRTLSFHDAVVNLAGASIFHRWSRSHKAKIFNSRINTTRRVVEAVSDRESRVRVFVNASAVGYYGAHGEELLKEDSPPGKDFLAEVTRQWEAEAVRAEETGVRVVRARFGIVMAEKGGALEQLKKIFSLRLGSVIGSGEQYFSWIHQEDLSEILHFILENENLAGPVNCTAPVPITNRSLTGKLGGVMGKPALLPPVPSFALRMVLGEFSSVLINGQRVIPAKLLDEGYEFRFPTFTPALQDLLF